VYKLNSVLIIDDDEDDVFLIQDRLSELSKAACHFVVCSEKEDAVKYLKERTFDICILDYRLAGYKGVDVLEAVADAQLATPIIMLTGQQDDKVAKEAIKLGAQDFVQKSCIDQDIFEKSILYAISRKELEFANLLGQRKVLENDAKDKFIAHLSHELRTPLTSILGYTSLLLEKPEAEPLQKELSIISNNGKHLLDLLNDVLDLSKIAAGKFELKEHVSDLRQILAEVNSLLSVSALDKGLSLTFASVAKIPRFVRIDELRFKQVLVNLIGNAIKFTDEGSVTVSLKFGIDAEIALLTFEISDTGIGMNHAQIQSVFSPFEQVEDVANRKAGGAGLGLSISAEIVKQMGGELNVQSSLGKGSVFSLTLPCKYEPQELIPFDFTLSVQTPSQQALQTQLRKLEGSVLVVDDVFEIRQLAGFFVRETGAAVEFAKNGSEALVLIKKSQIEGKPFNLVLMDLHMPVMTGESAMLEVKRMMPDLAVFAMTAAINKGLDSKMKQIGFAGLIGKPIDKGNLLKILQKYLSSADTQRSEQDSLMSSKRIVHLIEDDADSAQIMSLMIMSLGYQVIQSSTGQQALHNAENKTISVHLVDLGLPDMSSQDLITGLFGANISGRVLILSGSAPLPDLLEQFPIEQHLIKPISKEMLTQVLSK